MTYETSVRSASQFFAALIGFSLKHILDAKSDTGIGSHKIYFLCISVFLFLRFFFGSANHLWEVYGQAETKTGKNALFCKDFLFLTAFGIVAASISSNDEIPAYFGWCLVLVLGALFWNLLHLVLRAALGAKSARGAWGWWCLPNGVQAIFFVIAPGFLQSEVQVGWNPESWFWGLLFLVNLGCLIGDMVIVFCSGK